MDLFITLSFRRICFATCLTLSISACHENQETVDPNNSTLVPFNGSKGIEGIKYLPKIINVPGAGGLTIQQGIDLAKHGDTVLVAPGIYEETLKIPGKKSITLESEAGAMNTTIIGPDPDGKKRVLVVESGSTVRGFSIMHKKVPSYNQENPAADAAIMLTGPATIEHNVVTKSNTGIQLFCASAAVKTPFIRYNVMKDNRWGMTTLETRHFIHSNQVHNNIKDGIYVGISSEAIIKNNLIYENNGHGINIGAWIYTKTNRRVTARITNNTIAQNSLDGIHMGIKPGDWNRLLVLPWLENNIIAFNNGWGISLDDDERIQPTVVYNNVYGNGTGDFSRQPCGGENISHDPWFTQGPFGVHYLAQGTLKNASVNAGGDVAHKEDLHKLTTQVDGTLDTSYVDLGFHYPLQLAYEPMSTVP